MALGREKVLMSLDGFSWAVGDWGAVESQITALGLDQLDKVDNEIAAVDHLGFPLEEALKLASIEGCTPNHYAVYTASDPNNTGILWVLSTSCKPEGDRIMPWIAGAMFGGALIGVSVYWGTHKRCK